MVLGLIRVKSIAIIYFVILLIMTLKEALSLSSIMETQHCGPEAIYIS
jgi:hypothetical protein